MLYKLGLFCLCSVSLFGAEHIYLKTPNITPEAITGSNVGIRPFRKTGVRIEAETIKDRLIIHNYGYGGSGLTLAFGGAKEVINILEKQNNPSKIVAVLGAGVVGLTTAYDLLELGYDVRIYSDDWIPNLTSNVAAGIWSPLAFPSDISEEKKMLHQRMLATSESRFLKSTTELPEFAGVKFICSYGFKNENLQESTAPKYKGEEVIVHFDNGVIKNGRKSYELGIDGQLFIQDLQSKVAKKGALLKQYHFRTLEDVLSLEEPIIINCTSLGSVELFHDREFIPVRGHVVYLTPQDGIDYLLSQNVSNIPNDSYYFFFIYPWSDRMILGGVYEHGKEEAVINQEVISRMIENANKCLSQ